MFGVSCKANGGPSALENRAHRPGGDGEPSPGVFGASCKAGVVWCGVVWCGMVWCGVVRCGAVRCGVVWCGVVWCGVVWCGVWEWQVSVAVEEHCNLQAADLSAVTSHPAPSPA